MGFPRVWVGVVLRVKVEKHAGTTEADRLCWNTIGSCSVARDLTWTSRVRLSKVCHGLAAGGAKYKGMGNCLLL